MAYGSVLGRNTKPQFVPTFAISGPLPGDTVTISYGGTTVEAVEDNRVWYAKAWAYGSYTVTLTATVGTKTATVNVDEVKLYEVTLITVDTTLNNNSWDIIRKVADMGQANNYWKVGDTKTVILNGLIGGNTFDNITINAFIIGIDHNSNIEGTNRIHFQFGKTTSGIDIALCGRLYGKVVEYTGFCMNLSNTNVGGWNDSYGRKSLLGNNGTPTSPLANSFMVALPSDFRVAMKSVTKYTDNIGNVSDTSDAVTPTTDYLFFLAEFEVQGVHRYANQYEQNYQAQYDYYKAGNSKIKYRHDAISTAVRYWCRSANSGRSTTFCDVSVDGDANYLSASFSYGLAPGFCV